MKTRTLFLACLLCWCGTSTADDAADNPAAGDRAWLERVRENIRELEYEFSRRKTSNGVRWSAPNRAESFRSTWLGDRLRITPRRTTDGPWQLELRTVAIGRGSERIGVVDGNVAAEGNRLVIRYDDLEEWFLNDRRGLEQGYHIPAPPVAADGTSEPLIIEMQVAGGLTPSLASGGARVEFVTAANRSVLRYDGLFVVDATGKTLPSFLGVRGDRLRIVIDDGGARYPVDVDPVITTPAWSVEGDQDGAQLGYSVATAGDVNADGFSDVLVAAPLFDAGEADEGRVFCFHGSEAGPSLVPDFFDDGEQVGAEYGQAVSFAGDVNGDGFDDVLVGTRRYDFITTDEGGAFLYLGSSSGLEADPVWSQGSGQFDAAFGVCLAGVGDVNGDGFADVLIASPNYDNGETNEGRAYLYLGSPTGLADVADWTVESDQAQAFFSRTVAGAGDVDGDGFDDVLIASPAFDAGQADEGRVFIYRGSDMGLSDVADWTLESNQSGAFFGLSGSTAGDTNGDGYADLLIGAPFFDNGSSNEGRAYLFLGSPTGPEANPEWTFEPDQNSAELGTSVATAGDVNGDGYADIIVGAPRATDTVTMEGRVFVFLGSATGPSTTPVFTSAGGQQDAKLGHSVATAGDVNGDGFSDVIFGGWGFDDEETDEGIAYLHLGTSMGLGADPSWFADGGQVGANFGMVVASAGDVNADGFSDVIVGTRNYDDITSNEGGAFLFLGSEDGPSTTPDWIATGGQFNAAFGLSVASAGDVNGDGFGDVLVGAPNFDNELTNEGRAFLYLGSSSGLPSMPDWITEGDQAECFYGRIVASAGDVNGDGFSDVLVASPEFDNPEEDEGRAFLYHGSPTGPSLVPDWTTDGDQVLAAYSRPVATAGDVNGDGFSDVIVGARRFGNGHPNEGRAYVFHGSATGLGDVADWTFENDQNNSLLGNSVGTAGDVNGDGFSDVIVSAYEFDGTANNEGRSYVFHGSASGLEATPAWFVDGGQEDAFLGWSNATAGDVNGDGFSDVIIGAFGYDDGETDEGRALVFLGTGGGLAMTPAHVFHGDQESAELGFSVATAGDVNGDGYADVIIGAQFFDGAVGGDEGRALIHFGNGGGLARLGGQERVDQSALIPYLGQADSNDSVRLTARGRSPRGRTEVRLEWEVKSLGTPLDGTGIGSGIAVDTGVPNNPGGSFVAMSDVVSGLSADTVYTWRTRLTTADPLFPRSPWMTLTFSAPTEAKFFTGGSIPGIRSVGCREIPFGEVGLEWVNGTDYTEILVLRNGVALATIAGDATTYIDANALSGVTTYSLVGTIGAASAPPAPCEVELAPAPIVNLVCDAELGGVQLTWVNGETYDAVEIIRDGVLVATLPSGSTMYFDATDLGLRQYLVRGILDDLPGPADFCAALVVPPNIYRFIAPNDTVEYAVSSGAGAFDAALTIEEDPGNPGFPHGIQGFSMGLTHDPALLDIVDVTPGSALIDLNGGAGPEFFATELLPDAFTLGVVVALLDPLQTFPASAPAEVADAAYVTNAGALAGDDDGESTALVWQDGLGTGLPIANVVVVGTVSEPATLVDGEITLTPAMEVFVRGDCEPDGAYSIGDPVFLLSALFGGGGPVLCRDACDADDTGLIDIADALYILVDLFADGPDPLPPFPGCGLDETDDGLDCEDHAGC